MNKIVWSPKARQDFSETIAFLVKKGEKEAEQLSEKIAQLMSRLSRFIKESRLS